MGLNDVKFVKGAGGLGRPLPGQDHYSGLVLYTASLPSGFSTANRIKKLFSVTDAEAAGIKADYSDETQATATFTVTAIGANGDSVSFSVLEPFSTPVALGSYIKTATETTTAQIAAAIAAAINLGTLTHGYKATVAASVVTITARKGLGVFLNTNAPLSVTYSTSATLAGTLVAFSGGVASKQAVWHYHIAEFFRQQPQGVLFVGFFAVPGTYTFTEITTMQTFAGGTIRQIGVYKDSAAFAIGDLTAIHNEIVNNNDANHMPLSALYGADISAISDLSTLTDLSLLTANKVSAVISQDGAALGAALYYAYGKSITNLGALLGAVALAKVNEDIAWVAKFNISNGTECDTIAFANGQLFSSIAANLVSTLHNQRYIFLRKFVGVAGSYFNDSHTAIVQSSDYAYIEDNRAIDKAIRNVYTYILPELNGPQNLNADGTLADTTVAHLISQSKAGVDQMVRDGELSADGATIDITQNIQSSGKLIIAIQIVEIATGRSIQVNIGYTTSIS